MAVQDMWLQCSAYNMWCQFSLMTVLKIKNVNEASSTIWNYKYDSGELGMAIGSPHWHWRAPFHTIYTIKVCFIHLFIYLFPWYCTEKYFTYLIKTINMGEENRQGKPTTINRFLADLSMFIWKGRQQSPPLCHAVMLATEVPRQYGEVMDWNNRLILWLFFLALGMQDGWAVLSLNSDICTCTSLTPWEEVNPGNEFIPLNTYM